MDCRDDISFALLHRAEAIPAMGDLPVVGHLFKTTGRTNDKTELLIFITPKIVTERVSTRG